jgi:hypothetical protein
MHDHDEVKTVYLETCASYHRIDDFRGKLLALLPTVSGFGVLFLLRDMADSENTTVPKLVTAAALFGLLVSLGLYFYELRGAQRCVRLSQVAKDLEGQLGVVNGQFTRWPHSVGRFINEPMAAAIIYPAALSAWVYIAIVLHSTICAVVAASAVFLFGFFGGWIFYLHVREP